jgi:hypothetical protein
MTTLDEMWQRLTEHQPYADKYGYGADWMIMCKVHSRKAARVAARVAYAAEVERGGWMLFYTWAGEAAEAAGRAVQYTTSAYKDVSLHPNTRKAFDAIAVGIAADVVRHIKKAEQLYDNP